MKLEQSLDITAGNRSWLMLYRPVFLREYSILVLQLEQEANGIHPELCNWLFFVSH